MRALGEAKQGQELTADKHLVCNRVIFISAHGNIRSLNNLRETGSRALYVAV